MNLQMNVKSFLFISLPYFILYKVLSTVETLQTENKRQIESQKSLSKQIMELKVDAVTMQTDDNKFEESMRNLEEEHSLQLQHQAELMCQVYYTFYLSCYSMFFTHGLCLFLIFFAFTQSMCGLYFLITFSKNLF